MSTRLSALFLKSSTFAIVSAVVSLATTILIVRWFGADAYSSYIVDLSVLSIIFLINEVVPSNFSIFKAQDDHVWLRSMANYAIATIITGILLIIALDKVAKIFQSYSNWMLLYGGSLAFKRYMDTRLQSSGRLPEFMKVDFFSAAFRLVILFIFYVVGHEGTDGIWASLALGTSISQIHWCSKNPREKDQFRYLFCLSTWKALFIERKKYLPYYAGIFLKRIKDNFVPLFASQIFISKNALASFFLLYRGLIFSVGQMRILEALINHRSNLLKAQNFGFKKLLLIAAGCQALCIAASGAIIFLSGRVEVEWLEVFFLSLVVWPLAFLILERAKAYSIFKAYAVNSSILAYLIIAFLGGQFLIGKNSPSIIEFSILLFTSEAFGLLTIKILNRKSNVGKN